MIKAVFHQKVVINQIKRTNAGGLHPQEKAVANLRESDHHLRSSVERGIQGLALQKTTEGTTKEAGIEQEQMAGTIAVETAEDIDC